MLLVCREFQLEQQYIYVIKAIYTVLYDCLLSSFKTKRNHIYFRHVTLFEELMLLKEFEKREHTFATRVLTKEDEQEEMEDKVILLLNFAPGLHHRVLTYRGLS